MSTRRQKKATPSNREEQSDIEEESAYEIKVSGKQKRKAIHSDSEEDITAEEQSANKEVMSIIEKKEETGRNIKSCQEQSQIEEHIPIKDVNSIEKKTVTINKEEVGQRAEDVVLRQGVRGEWDDPPWRRIQVIEAVSNFSDFCKVDAAMTKTVILGVDDAYNCAQLIIRILDQSASSSITIIERDLNQINSLRYELYSKMAELMTFLMMEERIIFSEMCLIRTDFHHKFQLKNYKRMYVLSSGEYIKYFIGLLISLSLIFFSFIDLGLPRIVYFKVALIILSTDIKYVCGYKIGIDKINEYIRLAGVETTMLDIASLGDNKKRKKGERIKKYNEDDTVSDNDFSADTQKYFTALKV